jgi:hypothetical protein
MGSSHIYAPKEVVEYVEKKSKARREAGVLVVKCDDFIWLWDFVFQIDGQEIKIPARHLVIDVISSKSIIN